MEAWIIQGSSGLGSEGRAVVKRRKRTRKRKNTQVQMINEEKENVDKIWQCGKGKRTGRNNYTKGRSSSREGIGVMKRR